MEDIAAVILFLVSDERTACTGSDYAVDADYAAGERIPGGGLSAAGLAGHGARRCSSQM